MLAKYYANKQEAQMESPINGLLITLHSPVFSFIHFLNYFKMWKILEEMVLVSFPGCRRSLLNEKGSLRIYVLSQASVLKFETIQIFEATQFSRIFRNRNEYIFISMTIPLEIKIES